MDQQPHVLILPFPAQGHIKPMVGLAALLCHTGLIHVTFLNTDHNHCRLTHLQALSALFPTLHFKSISDGLPTVHPHTLQFFLELISSIKSVTKPLFREVLADSSRKSERPVTCVIAYGIMSFAIDVAKELGVRVMAFRTFSACCLWSYFCLPNLIQKGQLPVGADEDMDMMVAGVPGMEGLLRRRDLLSICRIQLNDPLFQFFLVETLAMTRASALILNSFDDLEASILSHLAPLFSKIYTIGPLNALIRSRIGDGVPWSLSTFSNLWEADNSCMAWLDSQLLGSVVYVSFWSLAIMTRGFFFVELWHGLVNSGKCFLWAIRRDTIPDAKGEQAIPVELQEGTKERGLLVDWAPQEKVLAHPSTSGFLTHSGWKSTLESIVAGVPMICWP